MARPKKTRPTAESLIKRIALVPWWIGVLLAVVIYASLRTLAPAEPGSFAAIAQYALPGVFLIAALICSTARRQLLVPDAAPPAAGVGKRLDRLSVDEFETLLAEAFRMQGYLTVENVGGGSANRVDLVLRRDRESFLVLSKYWKESRIDAHIVQQLHRSMTSRGAMGGFVVTLGRFSRDATAFAAASNIRLIDGTALRAMVERVHTSRSRTLVGAS